MANISDSAGIFTGPTLDRFNELQRVVGRDGDVTGAAQEMRAAMDKVIAMQVTPAGTGNTQTRRKP